VRLIAAWEPGSSVCPSYSLSLNLSLCGPVSALGDEAAPVVFEAEGTAAHEPAALVSTCAAPESAALAAASMATVDTAAAAAVGAAEV
jgi:hypothetical protein